MEDTLLPVDEPSTPLENKGCISCGAAEVAEGFPNRLCSTCRQKFIKYPIPLWVKAFGGVIAALVLFSFFSLPTTFLLGLHLEKGIKAEKEKRYFTAEKEFQSVVAKVPGNAEANAHLFIASFYNQDYETMGKTSQLLAGKRLDDEDLFAKVTNLFALTQDYFGSDSLKALHERSEGSKDTISNGIYESYLLKNSSDKAAEMEYANVLFNRKEYNRCDSLLQQLLKQDEEYIPALTLAAASERYQKKPEPSLIYLDRLLNINKENTYAISSKARAFLMLKKDKEARELALQAYQLNKQDPYSLTTLAIAYHYNNQLKERDEVVKKAQESKDTIMPFYFQYALDVINNKEKLRD